MTPQELVPGDVVQIIPSSTAHSVFHKCLAVVSEPKAFGCQAYILTPGNGAAYIRLNWDEMDYIGRSKYLI